MSTDYKEYLKQDIQSMIRVVPDHPKPGVMYQDMASIYFSMFIQNFEGNEFTAFGSAVHGVCEEIIPDNSKAPGQPRNRETISIHSGGFAKLRAFRGTNVFSSCWAHQAVFFPCTTI